MSVVSFALAVVFIISKQSFLYFYFVSTHVFYDAPFIGRDFHYKAS